MRIIKNGDEPHYKVYKMTETIENKFYIGQTSLPLYMRLNIHRCNSKLRADQHFNKIGWEHVIVQIIDKANDKNELLAKETENILMHYEQDKEHLLNDRGATDWHLKCFYRKRDKTYEPSDNDFEKEKIYYGC